MYERPAAAAARYDVAVTTVYRWVREGRLPALVVEAAGHHLVRVEVGDAPTLPGHCADEVDVAWVAHWLHLSPASTRAMLRDGAIPGTRTATGTWVCSRAALRAWAVDHHTGD